MFFLGKYGVQTDFYFPVVKFGSTRLAVTADWTPAAADCKIKKNGGAQANTTNAVAISDGVIWKLTLTATEMQAADIQVEIVKGSSIEDQVLIIYTYGNVSAKLPGIDYTDGVRLGLTALPNAAAEAAGGLYTRGSGAGQINQQANGQVDSNIERVRNSAINVLQSGRVDSYIGAVAAGVIAAASFAANALDAVWSTAVRLLTAGTNIVLAKGVGLTGLNDLSQANVRTAVGLASANLDTQLAALPTLVQIGDEVWDEATADHATAGSTGKALTDAATLGNNRTWL